MKWIFVAILSVAIFSLAPAQAKEIRSNEFTVNNAPDWLSQSRVERITARILNKLEWTIRRTPVTFYSSNEEFGKAQSLGAAPIAVTSSSGETATVHMGPQVTDKNFDYVFGHEIVHVIVTQKYKASIPKWLEEGLANHLAKKGPVNYKALLQKGFPVDVRELAHPFQGTAAMIGYRYEASQALAEMLDKKCDLENLVRISFKRDMETYIRNTCEIKDLNTAFQEWVKKKAGS